MRSMKLLVVAAMFAALLAGPVLAQDAMSGSSAPAASDTSKPAKAHKHHTGKKHSHKKAAAPAAAPSEPAAQ